MKCKNCGEEILLFKGKKWIHDFSGSVNCSPRRGSTKAEPEEGVEHD
ncbi:hypothetical protein [Thermoplasma sp. Kam2015]|nr:hypothetical protein [Thermoplasma sp. Kam2015]